MINTLGGLKVFDSEAVGDPYEDWSSVRSPGRARRRRARGHPQRIVTRYRANGKVLIDKINGVVYVHPHDRIRMMTTIRDQNAALMQGNPW